MIDRVGQQFGNYRLISLLGRGGFAEVYLGQHLRLNTQAAVKILHTRLSEEEAAKFLHEAQIIAQLDHPNIVRVFDFDDTDGIPFLVMNYYPRGTLRNRYHKGERVTLPTVISLVRQVADALQYAHDRRLVHRDVKPENMLIGPRNEILLGDFGIAAIAHSTSSMSAQLPVGTLPYMAPEQIQAQARPASDQYALAVVAYEWLCGERPFNGTSAEILSKHLMTPPPSLRTRVPTLPHQVEQVLLVALAKDPKQRFASVLAFAQALEAACQGLPASPLQSSVISADST
ncbi:MAG: serine/threonine protein kinase, partial [Chloroflexi bacterium]|nr:serine/threonine protein kinase [Chloroflexota bacterium]